VEARKNTDVDDYIDNAIETSALPKPDTNKAIDEQAASLLPKDILAYEIPKYLSDDGAIIHYAKSCKFLFFAVRARYLPAAANLRRLFEYAVKRKSDFKNVGEILLKHPTLMTVEGEFIDYRSISVFSVAKYTANKLDMKLLYWQLLHWALSMLPDSNETKIKVLAEIELLHAAKEISLPTRDPLLSIRNMKYRVFNAKPLLDEVLVQVPSTKKEVLAMHLRELEDRPTEHGSFYKTIFTQERRDEYLQLVEQLNPKAELKEKPYNGF